MGSCIHARVLADDSAKPATAPTTQPTTAPSSSVPTLIHQLGDDDVKVRNAATELLKKLGKDALPALEDATASDDPEVRTRAQSIIASIEGRDRPTDRTIDTTVGVFPRPGIIRIAPGGALQVHAGVQMRITVANANGVAVRDVDVNENGRKLHLHEDQDGIALDVTDNGQTKSYKAKTAAELKEKEPDAYKDYEKCNLAGGGGIIHIERP